MLNQDMQDLYNEVYEATDKKIWAKGLEFARRKDVKVSGLNRFAVLEASKASDHEVRLDPVDLDWMCSCVSKSDPCEHVAATVIALKLEAEKNVPIEKYSSNKYIVKYAFEKALNKSLVLKRKLVSENSSESNNELEVKHSIVSIVSGRIDGPSISAKSYDLEIDRVMSGDFGARVDGYISTNRAWALLMPHLEVLTDSQTVLYKNEEVKVDKAKKAADLLEVFPDGPGYTLKLKNNPDIIENFSNGVCLYNGQYGLEIRMNAPNDLPDAIISQLKGGRYFPPNEKVELFSKLLPQLKTRFKVVELDVEEKATYEILGFCVKNTLIGPRKVETSFHISYGDPVKAYVDGQDFVCLEKSVPLRQLDRELTKRREFERDFFLELSKPYIYEGEKLFEWVNKITRFRIPFIGDDLDNLKVVGKSAILAKLLNDDISFNVEIEGDEFSVEPEDLLETYEKESQFIKTEKGYVQISPQWLDEYQDLIRSFVVAKNSKSKGGVADLEKIRIIEGFGFSPPKKLKAFKDNLFSSEQSFDFTKISANLRSYQEEGIEWLNRLKGAGLGALLADDMGLGKTLQSLSVFESKTLVVCPTSLMFNWAAEIEKFRPDLSLSVYHGVNRTLDMNSDVVITTYGILRSDIDKLNCQTWNVVCVDEAQVIKNPQSKAASALWKLDSKFKLALTGTPIENHYKDLWSIFNFITPGLLGELSYFEKFVVRPIQNESLSALEDFKGRVGQFILRRTKKDVLLELPEKTEMINYCELTEAQKSAYEEYLSGVRTKMAEEEIKPIQIFELILRLRQFACDPRLVDANYKGGSGKIDLFKSLISEVTEEKHKSLVFSQWTSFLDLIQDELRDLGIKTYRLDGSTRNRQQVVEAYNNESEACVFLLSLKAGGVGLNLTSADHVFLLDPWWNPATERQAIDRAHRIGQKNPVMIHRLVGKNTIEEKVVKLQKIKEDMSNMVLEDMDSASISKSDILALLE